MPQQPPKLSTGKQVFLFRVSYYYYLIIVVEIIITVVVIKNITISVDYK